MRISDISSSQFNLVTLISQYTVSQKSQLITKKFQRFWLIPWSTRLCWLMKFRSRCRRTHGFLDLTLITGVTLRCSFPLFVAAKCSGTGFSSPLSMSYACCVVLTPTGPPDWPPYCFGCFSDWRTYMQPLVLQLIWSMICKVSPVLLILSSFTTSPGCLVI